MRGTTQSQPDFLTVVNLNATVPEDHPLRAIKRRVDSVLQKLSPLFNDLYVQEAKDDDPGNPTVDFHGEKRCHDTPQSTTDPESVLYRQGIERTQAVAYFVAGTYNLLRMARLELSAAS